MTHRKLIALLAAAMTAAACFRETPAPTVNDRDRVLDRALAAARGDPARAAELFAEAGPGAALEWARLELWADCLDRSSAPADAWRGFLKDSPPPVLAARARVALAHALAAESRPENLLAEPLLLPAGRQPEADELLLGAEDESARLEAAGRLAVAAPQRLRSADRELERKVVKDLSPQQLLRRSRAWRHAGAPASAAAELRTLRFSGEDETLRRRELARAELAAGSPRRALAALPPRGGAEDRELRALALRKRAWQYFPDRRARRAFEDCLTAASSALHASPDSQFLEPILELQLECGTEAGRLETAFAAWRRLEALGWSDSRREWLGRRLGVAADSVGMADAADEPSDSKLPRPSSSAPRWIQPNRRHRYGASSRPVWEVRRSASGGASEDNAAPSPRKHWPRPTWLRRVAFPTRPCAGSWPPTRSSERPIWRRRLPTRCAPTYPCVGRML
ncbi:MAG: hypothetical protein P8Y93_12785 [Acidobacteriota bacterium]